MKISSSSTGLIKRNDANSEKVNELSTGITKRLLEKYKHKVLTDIETMRNRKDQKRVA